MLASYIIEKKKIHIIAAFLTSWKYQYISNTSARLILKTATLQHLKKYRYYYYTRISDSRIVSLELGGK